MILFIDNNERLFLSIFFLFNLSHKIDFIRNDCLFFINIFKDLVVIGDYSSTESACKV